uniref:Zona pellucida sperm-binding protein 4 n=1 Tax=Taeniopygia guttata TaxID=59729 RepID=H0Z9Z8_TAEGU
MGVVGWSWAPSGAMFFWVFLGPLALVLGAHVSVFSDPTLLTCGQKSLQLTLPPGWEGNASFVLTTWDTEGKAHALQNDSGCGLLVSGTPDGSRKVSISYAGCYVFEWDHNYLILVGLEGTDAAGCPVDLPALDAPSSSVCLAIPSQDRLPCASLPISQGDCGARGCCYDPRDRMMPCYSGNTVFHCCFSNVTLPPVALDSVQLASGHSTGCVPVLTNNAFVVYQFPLSACGITFQMTGDQGIYENELVASRDVKTGSLGSVSRDSIFRYYPGAHVAGGSSIPLSAQVFMLPPLPAVSQPGPLSLELCVASNGSYTSYYTDSDYPVVKTLRDSVYAEVKILQRADPELVLVLHHCWATPNINPQEQQQWPILVDGCPYAGDNYQTQLMPPSFTSGLLLPSHYQCFTLYTFTFMNPTSHEKLFGLVYLHCSTSVCHRSLKESCITPCPPRVRGKRSAEHPFQEGTSHASSKGLVIFLQDELRQDTAKDGLGKCGSRAGEGGWSNTFLQKA